VRPTNDPISVFKSSTTLIPKQFPFPMSSDYEYSDGDFDYDDDEEMLDATQDDRESLFTLVCVI